MNRHQLTGSIAALLVCATVFVGGAGSDVADAVMKGDAEAVRRLVQQKADVNAPQVDGATIFAKRCAFDGKRSLVVMFGTIFRRAF